MGFIGVYRAYRGYLRVIENQKGNYYLGFRVEGSVQGSGLRVWSLGLRF